MIHEKNYVMHYGTPRESGRYPWGSGEDPEQRARSFLGSVNELKSKGLTETEIAKSFAMTTGELRALKSQSRDIKRGADMAFAYRLKEKGMSDTAIGKRMGINESSVRSLLKTPIGEKRISITNTKDMLAEEVASKKYLDISPGTELYMGISRTKLNNAARLMEVDGDYSIQYIQTPQLGTGKKTTIKVLTKSDVSYGDLYRNRGEIQPVAKYSEDGGRSYLGLEPIRSIDSKRIMIRYDEDGGRDKDGVIELRTGVPEISLGESRYAQVRVGVDGTHYMKGMAIYNDAAIPKGYDIVYNTNKAKGTDPDKVFKSMKDDPDNPFGSMVRQTHYIDNKGKEQLSALNIVGYTEGSGVEGSWGSWSKTLSSQVLSKQDTSLAKRQLDIDFDKRKAEYDEISSLENPVIKKKLLAAYADECDSGAVHLKAAALPRQQSHVILPVPSLKEFEVYAPNYNDGEMVTLIRHPHGGVFEIPQLKVNNRQKDAKALLGAAKDAVGINPKVAEQLSGADFDGDTVLVIPNNNKLIKTAPPVQGLATFDTKAAYPAYAGMKPIKPQTKQTEMGNASNLITDMHIRGADVDEIARAVRYSMVVIDSEKHNLNYKQAYKDNGIADLKTKYQGSYNAGASTLISRAKSQTRIDPRKEGIPVYDPVTGKTKRQYIDSKTGAKLYESQPDSYVNAKGKVVNRTIKSTKMYEVDDAYKLSSGSAMEAVYADYANSLKGLGNKARLDTLSIPNQKYDPVAKKQYSTEVASLNSKLKLAIMNKPLERRAQLAANTVVNAKKADNPNMSTEELKKLKNMALTEQRARIGAKKHLVNVTDAEWKAIQAGAVSHNVLTQIIDNADLDQIKSLATPRTTAAVTASLIERAKRMISNGNTQAEAAAALGISVTTLNNHL